MPHIDDHTAEVHAGYISGWAINTEMSMCPACATALLAPNLDEGTVVG